MIRFVFLVFFIQSFSWANKETEVLGILDKARESMKNPKDIFELQQLDRIIRGCQRFLEGDMRFFGNIKKDSDTIDDDRIIALLNEAYELKDKTIIEQLNGLINRLRDFYVDPQNYFSKGYENKLELIENPKQKLFFN